MTYITRSGSYPDFSSGGSSGAIPNLFSRKLLHNYYKKDVISKITNSK